MACRLSHQVIVTHACSSGIAGLDCPWTKNFQKC